MSDRFTLLLADDDPTITSSLVPFFERAGYHVLTAACATVGCKHQPSC